MKEAFVNAIHNKRVIDVTFNSKEKGVLTRKCIPFDLVPSEKSRDGRERLHFYDLERKHNLSIIREHIININLTEEVFNPSSFINWSTIKWNIKRNWEMDS